MDFQSFPCPLAYTGDVNHPPSNCWDWDSLQITSLVIFYFLSRGVYLKRGENYSSYRVDVGSSGMPITRVTLKASFQLKELQCMCVTLESTLTSKFSTWLDTLILYFLVISCEALIKNYNLNLLLCGRDKIDKSILAVNITFFFHHQHGSAL